MTYKLGERSLKNLEGVHPKLVKLIKTAIVNSPVDFTITEGLRSDQRQKDLYAQGRTKPGLKVTNKDGVKSISNHQDMADGKRDGLGKAVDLYPFFLGKVQVNHPDTIKNLKLIATHIKKVAKELGIAITWGGDWKSPFDPPHFELK
ncbi:M15 family metallopeptidase [Elizabethkingia bruuniana]|uniref:M15 family metallopeptidase n=1 Tax=Elizabethkingia bruuniana TaxID=1756149 RepID=UPI0020134419|nr:M15 family metallopeptidase [Elizabethkingia bruuniana]MCL1636227.1 M15 family metallopeptidase [Elizabethkingia bruuniana]